MPNTADMGMLDGIFAAIDDKDVSGLLGYLTNDASFRFGSAPAAEGHAAIRAAVGAFFDSISALSHTLDNAIRSGDTLFCEGQVSYKRHDGTSVTLPFADVFEMDGDLIASYKIYMDIAPLFAE